MTPSVSPKASHLWSLVSRTPTVCMTLSTLGKTDKRCQRLFLTNAIPPPPPTFPSRTEAEQKDQSSLCLRSLVLTPQHTLVYSLIHPPHHWFTPRTKLRKPHSTPGPQSSQELPARDGLQAWGNWQASQGVREDTDTQTHTRAQKYTHDASASVPPGPCDGRAG